MTFFNIQSIIKLMNQKGSIALLLLLVILLSGVSFIVGFYSARQNYTTKILDTDTTPKINIPKSIESKANVDKCSYYGYLFNKDDYLPKYTVKKGDTLSSLAKAYLGSAERSAEIIELNKDRYQNLYSNSFLEIGWVLYIPPSFSFPTQRLAGYSGEVIDITSDSIVINYYSRAEKEAHPVMRLKKDIRTKYFEKDNFEIGDCVTVLTDSICYGEECKLVAIAPEQSYKKYFTESLNILNK